MPKASKCNIPTMVEYRQLAGFRQYRCADHHPFHPYRPLSRRHALRQHPCPDRRRIRQHHLSGLILPDYPDFEQKLHLALPIVYFLVLVVGVTSSRMILRAILTDHHRKQMTPVIIYGAGQSGRQLLEAIKQVNEYSAIALSMTTRKSNVPSSMILPSTTPMKSRC